ncbi:MAG: lipase family protein, partial [Bacteroidetes bacterium]|nr:lipase family protein [Bacteroidota bacterium]
YGSAAPKTGNTFFAYDFDFITRGGWAFTIVNAADWVPETPFSVQQVSDFNTLNPFVNIDGALKGQPWIVRMVLKGKFNRMKRSLRKSQRLMTKNLGHLMYKQVKKFLPQLKEPVYTTVNNYQRMGVPIVLQPDAAYYKKFPDSTTNVFQHHAYAAYRLLATQYYSDAPSAN